MFDPYHKWLGIPKDQRPPTYHQLLGIAPDETDAEVIEEAAMRQTAHVRTYQIGPHAADCTRLLNEIAQAKLTLLNPAKREAYRAQLAARRETRVTAKAGRPGAGAAVAPASDAFRFDEEIVSPPAPPRREDGIGRPELRRASSGRTALMIGLSVGGAAAVLVVALLAVALSRLSVAEPPVEVFGGGIVGKVEKNELRPMLPIAGEQKEPRAPLVPPGPPVQPPPVIPVAQQLPAGARGFRIKEGIDFLALSPDGTKVALGWGNPHVYDLEGKYQCTFPWPGKGGVIHTPVAFHPDSRRVFYAYGCDFAALLGDSATGQALFRLESPQQYIVSLAVSPDGKHGLTGHNTMLVYWDLENQKELHRWNTKRINAVVFSPDGRHAVAGDIGGFIHRVELQEPWGMASTQSVSGLRTLSLSADGKKAAVGAASAVGVVDVLANTAFRYQVPAPAESTTAVAWCAKGTLVLTGGRDGIVRLWNLPRMQLHAAWRGHEAPITQLVVDAKERFAVSGDKKGNVMIWPLDEQALAVAQQPPAQQPAVQQPGQQPAINAPGKPPALGVVLDPSTQTLSFADAVAAIDSKIGITFPTVKVDEQMQAKVYLVRLRAGQRYQFDMMSTVINPVLAVLDANDKTLAMNDDFGDGLNARLVYQPPADAVYRIAAASLNDNSMGAFTFSVRSIGAAEKNSTPAVAKVPIPVPPGAKPPAPGRLLDPTVAFADVVAATDPKVGITFPNGNVEVRLHAKTYHVRLRAGRHYQFDMMSTAIDPVLAVLDVAGRAVAVDDDGGEGLNSRLIYQSPADGVYRVVAAALNDNNLGAFTLNIRAIGAVEKSSAPAVAAKIDTQTDAKTDPKTDAKAEKAKTYKVPAAGVSLSERLTAEDANDAVMRGSPHKVFRVALSKTRTYVIELYGNGFDAYLRLEDADGKQLLADDDSAGQLNSRIVFRPPASGFYRVIATSLGSGRGEFVLRIR